MKKITINTLVKSLCAVVVATLASCASVNLSEPLPSNTSADQRKEIEGQWVNSDGACIIKFDAKGVGRLASLKWNDEKQEFQKEEHEFWVTSINTELYVSAKFEEDNHVAYVLAKCAVDDTHLILWGADPDTFAALIEAKQLTGTVEEGKYSKTVSLTTSSKLVMELLEKSKRKDLFMLEEPMILQRITKQ